MKNISRLLLMSALALLVCIPTAMAQTPESSTLIVTEPLDVGGTIIQPGTYVIRVMPSAVDRNKVQIVSTDLAKVYATVLTVPHPLEPNEEIPSTTFVYYPAADGSPVALRTWFAGRPPTFNGHDIVYSESRAKQLARLANSRVVFSPPDTTASLQVVTPDATIETYTPVEAPMISSTTTETVDMPATASSVPLMALLGLMAIAGAVGFRALRPE